MPKALNRGIQSPPLLAIGLRALILTNRLSALSSSDISYPLTRTLLLLCLGLRPHVVWPETFHWPWCWLLVTYGNGALPLLLSCILRFCLLP